ncbi:DUF1552 domain-containing protein [Pseudobacteriovorax antillogorgiicola]|uniref:DUF1552 domain-containing protein n=1 Tax=Pseudobacteriovorax antillogorgiicola TaxID=1513793 RepID=A0A1Y6CK57_9BACT|nr:DUF1552 domain-containing protein [Pseudobacteriovorax antillogorgiicola]TCS47956.1 uncharacterized protein DUF1552 [Pseudobacteriovorax antillogorgiicola]SMF58157.1 Protein of unknown function [Pseudobacteriovorax antillogorgiicola]
MKALQLKSKRRDFIRNMIKSGSFLACVDALGWSSLLAAPSLKRFVMIYYPNGCVRDRWHSYPIGELSPASLSRSPLEPLTNHLDKLTLFKNLSYAGHGGSSSHPEACRGVFSGGVPGHMSFDTSLGMSIPGRLTNNIHLGLWTSLAKGSEYMPFTDESGRSIVPADDPLQVYDQLIGDLGGGDQGNPQTASRKRILSALMENLDLMQSIDLPTSQAQKLIAHENSLQYYQKVLEAGFGDGVELVRPSVSMGGINEEAEDICKAQMKNIATMMQADVSKIFSFQFMAAQDESLKINFPSIRPYMGSFGSGEKLNYNETRSHVSSHNESALFDSQTRWYNMMIAYLVDELTRRIDPVFGGALIDHTLILVMSEVGGGNHQMENPGVLTISGQHSPVARRRAIDCRGAGMSSLFLDIARAFGLSWDNYGNSFGTGIPGYIQTY